MNKLFDLSLKRFIGYAAIVLAVSIPVYYFAIYVLWQYEMDEHNIVLTPEAHREDRLIIIGAVTILTVVFFALLLAGFILVNRKISKSLWQPFYESLAQMRSFDINQKSKVHFSKSSVAEFEELNESIEKLIAGTTAAYRQQKEFADNASHELQTPLAIVQSKLELLMQTADLHPKEHRIIEEALGALSRMTRINKNLLLLTKIENSQFTEQTQLNLSTLLHHSISLCTPFIEDKNLITQIEISPDFFILANGNLVEILLNNLLTNAIRHSQTHSHINISLFENSLTILNDGNEPLQHEQLFKRFAIASKQAGGTGLGLSICKQICDRYQWKISYAFKENHHIFSVKF